MLAKACSIFYKYQLNTVLFVQEKKQGEIINKFLTENFKFKLSDIKYMTGNDSQDVRGPVLRDFKKGIVRTIVCTKILNEGIDFPEANCGIRAAGQKFEGGIIQQLGRILRKVRSPLSRDIDRKRIQRVFWLDILDLHDSRLARHTLERINVYESEPAFDVRYVDTLEQIDDIIKERIKDVKIIKRKNQVKL
jgi:superfamily II DNA or RNA helicase